MPRVFLNLLVAALPCHAITARADTMSGYFDFKAKLVEQGDWQPHLSTQGQVLAEREVALSLPFAALIKAVPVYGDQSVIKGQVLAEIDSSPLVGLLSDLQTADQKLDLAQQHLSITEQRFHEKLATRDDLIQAQASLNIATSDFKNSWLAVNNVLLRLGDAVSEATLRKQLNESVADVIAQQRSKVRAPFDGVIAQRMIGPGTHVASGQPLFVLDDMSRVFVSILVSPAQLARWQTGTGIVYAKTNKDKGTSKNAAFRRRSIIF